MVADVEHVPVEQRFPCVYWIRWGNYIDGQVKEIHETFMDFEEIVVKPSQVINFSSAIRDEVGLKTQLGQIAVYDWKLLNSVGGT